MPSIPPMLRLNDPIVSHLDNDYRTAVFFLANPVAGTFLFSYYQRGQVLLEVSFACPIFRLVGCLEKLEDVSQKMNLHVPEWTRAGLLAKRAEAGDAKTAESGTHEEPSRPEPNVFWDKQFQVVHPGSDTAPKIAARLTESGFVQHDANGKTPDQFTLTRPLADGQAEIRFTITPATHNEEEFNKAAKGVEYAFYPHHIYLVPAVASSTGTMQGTASVYLGGTPAKKMDMAYTWPTGNSRIGQATRNVISSLQITDP